MIKPAALRVSQATNGYPSQKSLGGGVCGEVVGALTNINGQETKRMFTAHTYIPTRKTPPKHGKNKDHSVCVLFFQSTPKVGTSPATRRRTHTVAVDGNGSIRDGMREAHARNVYAPVPTGSANAET